MTVHHGWIDGRPGSVSVRDTVNFDVTQTHQGGVRGGVITGCLSGRPHPGAPSRLPQTVPGYFVPGYFGDFYNQILVMPPRLALGTINSTRSVAVQVWNAYQTSQRLLRVEVAADSGVTVSGPAAPLVFSRLQINRWTVTVSPDGPPDIQCRITWFFDGPEPVSFTLTGSRSNTFELAPDWSEGVTETLEWSTRVLTSRSGAEQRSAQRLAPRRLLEFVITGGVDDARRLETLFWNNGANTWQLPLFYDVATTCADTPADGTTIHVITAGRDYTPGGSVQLRDGNRTELAQIATVADDRLTLSAPVSAALPAGARVVPLRHAVIDETPRITRKSDSIIQLRARFRLTETPPAVSGHGMPEYRGAPVLDINACWSEDLTAEFQRLAETVDNMTGRPVTIDTAGRPFPVLSYRFTVAGLAEHARLRQLLYWLRGRQRTLWVSTQASDFGPVADIDGNYIDVVPCGFADAGLQPGRQDICIEVAGGGRHWRRITAVSVAGSVERLAFDGKPLTISRAVVLKISFLVLCRLQSDSVSWEHKTDEAGLSVINVNFIGVRDELE